MNLFENRLIYQRATPTTAPTGSPATGPARTAATLDTTAWNIIKPGDFYNAYETTPFPRLNSAKSVDFSKAKQSFEELVLRLKPAVAIPNPIDLQLDTVMLVFNHIIKVTKQKIQFHELSSQEMMDVIVIFMEKFYGVDFEADYEVNLQGTYRSIQAIEQAYTINTALKIPQKFYQVFPELIEHIVTYDNNHRTSFVRDHASKKVSLLTPGKFKGLQTLISYYLKYLQNPPQAGKEGTYYQKENLTPEISKKYCRFFKELKRQKIDLNYDLLTKVKFLDPFFIKSLNSGTPGYSITFADDHVKDSAGKTAKLEGQLEYFKDTYILDPRAARRKANLPDMLAPDEMEYHTPAPKYAPESQVGYFREIIKNLIRSADTIVFEGKTFNSTNLSAYILDVLNGEIGPPNFTSSDSAFSKALAHLDSRVSQYYKDHAPKHGKDLFDAFKEAAAKYPGIPENQQAKVLETSNNMLLARVTRLIKFLKRDDYENYTFFNLLKFSTTKPSLLETDPRCRIRFLNLLIDHVVTSDEEKKQLADLRDSLDTSLVQISKSPALSRKFKNYQKKIAGLRQLVVLSEILNDPNDHLITSTLARTLDELDTASTTQFAAAAGSVYLFSQTVFSDKLPAIARAAVMAPIAIVLSTMMFKDKTVMQGAAAIQKHVWSLKEEVYKTLRLDKDAEGKFLPFIFKSFLSQQEFSTISVADLRSYLKGSASSNFLSGNSILVQNLRAQGPRSEFAKEFKEALRLTFKHTDRVLTNALKQANPALTLKQIKDTINSSCISDYMFMWFSVDPLFSKVYDLQNLEVFKTTLDHNQAQPEDLEYNDHDHQWFLKRLRGKAFPTTAQPVISPEAAKLDDTDLLAAYNIDLANKNLSGISPHYGALYAQSETIATLATGGLFHQITNEAEIAKKFKRDALGNIYSTLRIAQIDLNDWSNRGNLNHAAKDVVTKALDKQGVNIAESKIYVTFNATKATSSSKGDLYIGISCTPTYKVSDINKVVSPAEGIDTIDTDPIESSTMAESFHMGIKLGRRSPIIRILEHLSGFSSAARVTRHVGPSTPVDTVYRALETAYSGVSEYKNDLERFIVHYRRTSENSPLNEQILTSLVNYIKTGAGSRDEKRKEIDKLNNLNGIALYFRLMSLTVGGGSSTQKSNTSKAYATIKRLDNRLNDACDTGKYKKYTSNQKKLLKSATYHLNLLLGLIMQDTSSTLSKKLIDYLGIQELFDHNHSAKLMPAIDRYFDFRVALLVKQNFGNKPITAINVLAPEEFAKEVLQTTESKSSKFITSSVGKPPSRVKLTGDDLTRYLESDTLKSLLVKKGTQIQNLNATAASFAHTAVDFMTAGDTSTAKRDTFLLPETGTAPDTAVFNLTGLEINGTVQALKPLTPGMTLPKKAPLSNLGKPKFGEELSYVDVANPFAVFIPYNLDLSQTIEYVLILDSINTPKLLEAAREKSTAKARRNLVMIIPQKPASFDLEALRQAKANLNTTIQNNYTFSARTKSLSSFTTVAAYGKLADKLHNYDNSDLVNVIKCLNPATSLNAAKLNDIQIKTDYYTRDAKTISGIDPKKVQVVKTGVTDAYKCF